MHNIQTVELVWPRAMDEERLPRKLWDSVHLEEEQKEVTEIRGCREEITGMRERKELTIMEWVDRQEWRRKRKLELSAQEYMQTSRICTQINKI